MLLYFYCLIMSAQMILARVGVLTCVSDNDCNNGYTCSKNKCIKCLTCDFLGRKGSDCVVNFNKCGECLIGYEEVLITDSLTAIKPCQPVRLKEKLNRQKCENDNTCPPENYCHKQSCVKCFNCSLVNRLPTPQTCTKLLSDCGSCMNGFEEVAVTFGTSLKLCKRSTVTDVPKTYSLETPGSIAWLLALSVVFCCLVLIITVKHNLKKKHKVLAHIIMQSQCPQLPSAPPLSVMDSPQHIKRFEEEKFDIVQITDNKQQAKVFKQPTALYYYEENETASDHNSEDNVQSLMPNSSVPTSSQLDNDMIHSGVITGQSADVSEPDSVQLPNEMNMGPTSVDEEVDDQPAH